MLSSVTSPCSASSAQEAWVCDVVGGSCPKVKGGDKVMVMSSVLAALEVGQERVSLPDIV